MAPCKVILVGSRPPPLTGQTIAFQMACEGFRERKIPYEVIDLSGGEHLSAEGTLSLRRVRQLLKPFLRGRVLLAGDKVLYLSATQNWIGFLRDSLFVLLAAAGRQRIVIHAHWGNYAAYYASLGAVRQYLVRSVLGRVDRILILGENLRSMFDFDPALRGKTEVVYNGLPYAGHETPPGGKRLPRGDNGRPQLLFLSNLMVSKGYLQVLEALRILVGDLGIDVECHFCGSFVVESSISAYSTVDEAEADFRMKMEEWNLGGHAVLHGTVDGGEKLQLLTESHFLVLPTRLREGQPISIIEALAFGLVVVTTPMPGILEMVEEGKSAELVSSDRPYEIAQVIESYVRDPDRYEAVSRASVDRYRQAFTRERHLARLIPLVMGSASGSQPTEGST